MKKTILKYNFSITIRLNELLRDNIVCQTLLFIAVPLVYNNMLENLFRLLGIIRTLMTLIWFVRLYCSLLKVQRDYNNTLGTKLT